MAKGPGKYDRVCTLARDATEAEACILIVVNGKHGSGFSCQVVEGTVPPERIASALETVVKSIREDIKPQN